MEPLCLPALRQELRIEPGSSDENGAPRWLLIDEVRNRYFTLSEQALGLLRYWRSGENSHTFAAELTTQHGINVSVAEVDGFIYFLRTNHLIQDRTPRGTRFLEQVRQRQRPGFFLWLLHHYLFIRIPLWRPQPWLNRYGPRLNRIFNPKLHYVVLVLGAIGILWVLRQWELFKHTFLYFLSAEGLIYYVLALIFVKSAHELGHALVSFYHRCHVASIGVAFIVLFPVLYTDTTAAWRLRSRWSRLAIVSAGVRTELYIALLATFLWSIVPEGPIRSVMFFLATTSWLTSVVVNTSPFMRFDGYYAFSDLIGVENLQTRAFVLGRWWLRKTLWGLDDPQPEPLRKERFWLLIGYAFGTWIYRFFLFLGIALVVYHLFFKVLGIFLFVTEICWFLLWPIGWEFNVWRKRRKELRWNRWRLVTVLIFTILMLLAALPIRQPIHLPAVLFSAQNQQIYAPEAAMIKVIEVHNGQQVQAGDPLLQLESLPLKVAMAQLDEQIRMLNISLSRQAASTQDKMMAAIAREQRKQLEERREGLLERQAKLTIKAPITGRIEWEEPLSQGSWVARDQGLLRVVDAAQIKVDGFAYESVLAQLQLGQKARFIAEQPDVPTLPLTLSQIEVSAVASLPFPELSSMASGAIAVRDVRQQIPEQNYYRVHFSPVAAPPLIRQQLRGEVVVDGLPRSILGTQFKRVLTVLIRESGF